MSDRPAVTAPGADPAYKALAELEDAVSAVLGTLNFYTGPNARTAVSPESVQKYVRVRDARDRARALLGPRREEHDASREAAHMSGLDGCP
jgi:hypothetical protein